MWTILTIIKERDELKTKVYKNSNFPFNEQSVKLETSTPKKLVEETLCNKNISLSNRNANKVDNVDTDDDDDNDDFYSQSETLDNSDNNKSYTDLALLESRNELDTLYGPHKGFNNEWKFGNSSIKLTEDKIVIGNHIWAFTPGLFSLLFHKTPKYYDKHELDIYKKILVSTNAYKRDYRPDGQIKGTRAYKYKHIISKLFKKESEKNSSTSSSLHAIKSPYKGKGLMKLNPYKANYIYWDDPNELVDRLRLLLASQAAGHTNHNNEIVSIIEELYEAKIIE